MGLMQREKGKRFERLVARQLREWVLERWPGVTVRRASQAERAHEPDVFFDVGGGDPAALLRHVWLELQDAREPDPIGKLEQAECDVLRLRLRPRSDQVATGRLPVVVWHRLRERAVRATMRLATLDALARAPRLRALSLGIHAAPVTIAFADLLKLLAHYVESEAAG